MENLTPNENKELVIAEQQPQLQQPNKRRKKKSVVWEHFTIESAGAGCRRAQCKQCKQTFAYSTGSKVAGTSHLKRHIAKGTCPMTLRNQEDRNQLTPYATPLKMDVSGSSTGRPKRRYRTANSSAVLFDPDRCRHEIAKMIVMHDYPLHMVEHPGFVAFAQSLQPRFDMVSFSNVQGDCVASFLREKQGIQKLIDGVPRRVSLSLDLWTSSLTLGYVFVTGHFIDNNWKLQRRILNVVMEAFPDSETALSHAVAVCISDWNLENKLFSVTLNRPLREIGAGSLRAQLSIKNPLILNGQFILGNCIASTLSSMAQAALAAGQETIKTIRDSVKYVKMSDSHEEKFLELKEQLQVPSVKNLSLDNQKQWNTTYEMLLAASELREVFSCLDTSDPDYKEAPTMEDWRQVETLCVLLKLCFETASLLATSNPTANVFFHEVWKIQTELSRAVLSDDPAISSLSKPMMESFDKYWKGCSLVLALAVVMDPRFKMKLVEFSFSKIYGDDATTYIKIVDDGIHELFLEYVALPLPLTPTYADEGGNIENIKAEDGQEGANPSSNGLSDFDAYIMETTSQHMKSELDQYLEESLLPRSQDFDVLGWWKLNKLKYPMLSLMARDILSVPVSTVPSESVFDTMTREMDQYRCSLRPVTTEALICVKDWFQYGLSENSNAVVKMEFQ